MSIDWSKTIDEQGSRVSQFPIITETTTVIGTPRRGRDTKEMGRGMEIFNRNNLVGTNKSDTHCGRKKS